MLASRSTLSVAGVSLAALLVLSGCSASAPDPDTEPSKEPTASAVDACTTSGPVSDAVTVEGEFGVKPTVTFDTPLSLTGTERTVLIEGSGEKAEAGSYVAFSYTAYHGATGDEIDTTGYGESVTPAQIQLVDGQAIEGFLRAVNCASMGERVVAVMPPTDTFGEQGNPDVGVTADDAMVVVFDILAVVTPVSAADAADAMVKVKSDAPEVPVVEWGDGGRPTLKIPTIDAPADPTLAILEQGDGAIVGETDTIEINYEGVIWATGETFDSSWAKGAPISNPVGGFIPGFTAALIGQNAGTKLLVTIPPYYGYGEAGQGTIKGTDTIVFVVEIVGTTPAK